MDYRQLYQWGALELAGAGIGESGLDARLLLEVACGTDRNTLLAQPHREVTGAEEAGYRRMIDRRSQREPLQYITGIQEFMGLEFQVDGRVLIPRQDTEILAEEALRFLQDGDRILDVCTGSGCILLSLLHYSNHCRGVGLDVSQKALAVARLNEERLRRQDRPVPWERDTVKWLRSDLFLGLSSEGALPCRYEIVVSNPPYIESGELPALMPEVREHEPVLALDGGGDGLLFYRRIIAGSGAYLAKGGRLFLEIGCNQAGAVTGLMEEAGFEEIRAVKDYAGLDRVVHGLFP